LRYFVFLAVFFSLTSSWAQDKEISKDIAAIVFLDSFVVTASQQGFVVEDFIDIIQEDESFFQAFHNLRLQEHQASNSLQFFDRKRRQRASYDNLIHQQVVDKCRTMEVLEETIEGDFFTRKSARKHNYYTARMHESVFFTEGEICEKRTTPIISSENLSGIQKHINELKKLVFQPGKAVEVPLIGGKTAIFEKDMLPYYQFYIQQDTFTHARPCYTFIVSATPNKRSSKTIIKYLKTWFDQETFQVLGRHYHLQYSGVVGFDVKMRATIQQVGDDYIPATIEYEGTWKVPLQKRETGAFKVEIFPGEREINKR